MTKLGDLAAPIMRAATGLHGHRAGRQRCQERQKLAAAQLLAKDHRARTVSPMELKDVLGEIEADGANLVHERLLEWALTPPLWHADAVGGVHTIKPSRWSRSAMVESAFTGMPQAASTALTSRSVIPGWLNTRVRRSSACFSSRGRR